MLLRKRRLLQLASKAGKWPNSWSALLQRPVCYSRFSKAGSLQRLYPVRSPSSCRVSLRGVLNAFMYCICPHEGMLHVCLGAKSSQEV